MPQKSSLTKVLCNVALPSIHTVDGGGLSRGSVTQATIGLDCKFLGSACCVLAHVILAHYLDTCWGWFIGHMGRAGSHLNRAFLDRTKAMGCEILELKILKTTLNGFFSSITYNSCNNCTIT